MTGFNRRRFAFSALAAPAALALPRTGSLWASEHTSFTVRDPLAGYFDFEDRRRILRSTADPVLLELRASMMRPPLCQDVLEIPIQDQAITMPSFYQNNAGWRAAVKPFSAIEHAVSKLAGANLVAHNRGFVDCLVTTLVEWARRDGLANFNHSPRRQQGWFQVESTLFSMALALAAVRPDILDRTEELEIIDGWMERVATSHFAIPGSRGGTCCNNHFYRRARYATIIGVMVKNDDLFRGGVGAIYSALSGATSDGALPLEMERGPLAAHYQNFALMYLAMIAEIAERQGYPLWSLEIDGKSLHSLVAVNNRILADPNNVKDYAKTDEVSLRYRDDPQYFAWFEIYLSRFENAEMEAWIAGRRPLYNRSLGGHLTAYFYNP
ncbi:MAG: poly(beta-D-mannuronate) lyase [Silicimonas sp.]|nr:poly(beta-D-mannuronate) lyase [Silicimonas sp.]